MVERSTKTKVLIRFDAKLLELMHTTESASSIMNAKHNFLNKLPNMLNIGTIGYVE